MSWPAQKAEPRRVVAERYELEAILGRGGMGLVWRATDKKLDRGVAVKELIFPAALFGQERSAARARALREARAAARLGHPGVVTVFDMLEEDDRMFIVMELVDGASLEEVVGREGRLRPGIAADIGRQVLEVLDVAHRRGIVHRDVKPGNVMILPEGRVKLADFGIASISGDPTITLSGTVLGSPAYMAPEQALGEEVGPATDLWGLGATLYFAVEGASPFIKNHPLATLNAVLQDEPPRPPHGDGLTPVILDLLAKDPAARPSPHALIRRFEAVRDEAGYSAEQTTEELAVLASARSNNLTLLQRDTTPLTVPPLHVGRQIEEPAPVEQPAYEDVEDSVAEDAEAAGDAVDHRSVDAAAGSAPLAEPHVRDVEPEAPQGEGVAEIPGPGIAAEDPVEGQHAADAGAVVIEADELADEGGVDQGGAGIASAEYARHLTYEPRPVETPEDIFDWQTATNERRQAAAAPRRRRSWLLPVLAVVVAVGLLSTVIAVAAVNSRKEPSKQAAPAVVKSVKPSPRASVSPSPSEQKKKKKKEAQHRPSPTPSPRRTAAAAAALPSGWTAYVDREVGYRIAYPRGWRIVHPYAHATDFRDPASGTYVRVAWTDNPGPSPQDAWERYETQFAATHDGYQRIRITPTTYKGYRAAEWEFLYSAGGTRLHALDLGFITGKYGFALYFQTRASQWSAWHATFDRFERSFSL